MGVLTIGEAMLELRPRGARFDAGVAGDCFNTAAHLAALGHEVLHAQDLGDDALLPRFTDAFAARGIRRLGRLLPAAANGIYIVTVDETGERQFGYYRAGSAAGETVEGDRHRLQAAATDADVVYLSGITLATSVDPEKLLALTASVPTPLAVGLNIRSGLRRRRDDSLVAVNSDEIVALLRTASEQASLVFGSEEEFELLGALPGADRSRCVPISVISAGADGARSLGSGTEVRWNPPADVTVNDTAGAGDALAGGFLDAWLRGEGAESCLSAGARRSLLALAHPGALPPIKTARSA